MNFTWPKWRPPSPYHPSLRPSTLRSSERRRPGMGHKAIYFIHFPRFDSFRVFLNETICIHPVWYHLYNFSFTTVDFSKFIFTPYFRLWAYLKLQRLCILKHMKYNAFWSMIFVASGIDSAPPPIYPQAQAPLLLFIHFNSHPKLLILIWNFARLFLIFEI